jgi:thiol-disulfide isomerase/thioredoxin
VSCGGSEPPVDDDFVGGRIEAGSPAKFTSTLRSLRGKPVVVNFWATWCEPCKKEMPRLVAAAERYEGRIEFLGIDVQDDPDAAADFVRRYRMPFPSLSDQQGEIRRKEGLLGLPVTQFYDAEGDLALEHNGELSSDELADGIADVLRKRAES